MTDANQPVIPERLETILLARLAIASKTPPTAVALAKLTRRFAPTRLTEPQWRELVEATFQQLHARQIVGADRRLLRDDELQTRVGPHTAQKWEQWADSLLPALALGIRLDDAKARRRLSLADGWVSAIASRVLGLWQDGPPPSLKLLGDALVWRELGLPGTPEECPPTLRAHFLRPHITMKDGTPSQLVRQIASRAVNAPNTGVATVRDAVVRHWLAGGELGAAAAHEVHSMQDEGSASPETAPLSLIDAARDAAQAARDGVFGDRKVFISSVWRTLRARPAWEALALDEFKQQLVAAHRNQQLVLARADFVSAMDPELVEASETRTDGATFHFIVREPVR
jgi:hypothetical protein